jgi:hypothetical protein
MDDQNMNVPGTDPFHYTPDAAPAAPAQPSYAPAQPTYAEPVNAYSQPAFTPPPFGTLPDVPQEYPTGLATGSLVLGIISFVLGLFIAILPIPLGALPIIGIILGCVHKSKHYPVGKGSSTAGIVLSALTLVFAIGLIIVSFAMLPYMLEYIYENNPALYDEYFGSTYGYNF